MDRYRSTITQAVHRYVYEGQIIPDPVFPDPFMMLLGGCKGYCQNRRAYYFRAIDSGFWHQKAICLGLNFLAKVLNLKPETRHLRPWLRLQLCRSRMG